MSLRNTTEWMFRNRQTGKLTIGQSANLSQKIFQGTTLVGVLLPRGPLRETTGVVAVGSLTWWALDELVRGVNPFRRISGVIALGGVVYLALRRPRRR